MGKWIDKKQQKEQQLLGAAFTLFTTKGIANTSIADIAASAGVAKGTFYLYFRDKYQLQERLIVSKTGQIFRRAMERSNAEAYDSFCDWLIAIVDHVLQQLQEDQSVLRFINKNLSWGIFRQAIDRSSEDYLTIIKGVADQYNERVDNLQILVYTILELVGGTCYSVILEQDPTDLMHYKPYLYRSIRAIVGQFLTAEE
ncbi:MAG: TetR/AcrR family transcriptional regulator [Lachnospiraceae bacterium]|nr:TetR/AcrR family transcriptional regulator [Lachnospiraceae bacterium]